MSLSQLAFLFNYREFQTAVRRLTPALEANDPAMLKVEVNRFRDTIEKPQNWMLHEIEFLGDYDAWQDPKYKNALYGHWLLILLSEFLRPSISLGLDWKILFGVLPSFGWETEDIQRLLVGIPTSYLFKTGASYQDNTTRTWDSPYWNWIRPYFSTNAGWLSLEEIRRLLIHLQANKQQIQGDIRSLVYLPSGVAVDKAWISPDLDPEQWYLRIPLVYQQAVEMLGQAVEAEAGLFIVIQELAEPPTDTQEHDPADGFGL